MLPIYFPYTYVSEAVAETLSTCFGRFLIYQPVSEKIPGSMRPWIDRAILDIRVPTGVNEHELKTAIDDYRLWADLHQESSRGNPVNLRARLDSLSALGQSSCAKIIAAINEKIQGTSKIPPPDPELAARIFLYFAQEFDRQNHELAAGLKHHDRKQAELIRQLKMEDDSGVGQAWANVPGPLLDPHDDYLISDRLDAWIKIYCQYPNSSGLFVTHSQAVLEHLLEPVSTAAKIRQVNAIPLAKRPPAENPTWRKELLLDLDRLIQRRQDDRSDHFVQQSVASAADNTVSLSVYQVPDQAPIDFFTRHANIDGAAADAASPNGNDKINNTLLALVQRPEKWQLPLG